MTCPQLRSVYVPWFLLEPAVTARAENEKDREYREHETIGENEAEVDGLNMLKHGQPPRKACIAYSPCSERNGYSGCRQVTIAHPLCFL